MTDALRAHVAQAIYTAGVQYPYTRQSGAHWRLADAVLAAIPAEANLLEENEVLRLENKRMADELDRLATELERLRPTRSKNAERSANGCMIHR